MVRISIFGTEATIDGYRWSSPNKHIEGVLNAQLDPLGPSGSDPDPDRTAAQAVIERYGGKILQADVMPYSEGTVY